MEKKLSDEEVLRIFRDYLAGAGFEDLANAHSVSVTTIYRIAGKYGFKKYKKNEMSARISEASKAFYEMPEKFIKPQDIVFYEGKKGYWEEHSVVMPFGATHFGVFPPPANTTVEKISDVQNSCTRFVFRRFNPIK